MSAIVLETRRPPVPFVPRYCVVAIRGERDDPEAIAALCAEAHRVARREARRAFDDAEAYTLLFNAGRTRRRPRPHVHIVVAETVRAKRRALFWLALKHVTRAVQRGVRRLSPRRWAG